VLDCVTQCSQSAAHLYEQLLQVKQIGCCIIVTWWSGAGSSGVVQAWSRRLTGLIVPEMIYNVLSGTLTDSYFNCLFNIYTHITRFVKMPKSNKNSVCYNDANCLHKLCGSHMKKNVLLKFIKLSLWSPTAHTSVRLITLCISALQQSISHWFLAWTVSKTECAPAEGILINRSSTDLLITGVTNWRLWFDWMMSTLNSCFDYQIYLLPCSYVAYAFKEHCVRFAIVYRALRWYCDKK